MHAKASQNFLFSGKRFVQNSFKKSDAVLAAAVSRASSSSHSASFRPASPQYGVVPEGWIPTTIG